MENRKPFRTINEQMEILRSRGLVVGDNSRIVLMREGYYSLVNGYKDAFIDRQRSSETGEDRYKEGTTFDHLHLLFDLDRMLKERTFPMLVRAETTVRTAVAYCFSERYREMDSYLDPNNYCTRSQYHDGRHYERDKADLIRLLRSAHDNRRGHSSIDHYLATHGHVPLWVLVNVLTFGNVSHLYSLSTQQVKNAVCRMIYEEQGAVRRIGTEQLRKALSVLVDYRNVCAHDDRLYCARKGKNRDKSFADMLCAAELIVDDAQMTWYRQDIAKALHLFDGAHSIQDEALAKMGISLEGDTVRVTGIQQAPSRR